MRGLDPRISNLLKFTGALDDRASMQAGNIPIAQYTWLLQPTSQQKIRLDPHMDRSTKATLWIAFLVLLSYFVVFYTECAMDDDCHLVCKIPRGTCHTQRTPNLKLP
jgi:hypothetical protein